MRHDRLDQDPEPSPSGQFGASLVRWADDATPLARLVVTGLLGVVLAVPVFVGAFATVVLATGCFIECDQADVRPFASLFVGLLTTAVVAGWASLVAWAVGREDRMQRVFVATAVVAPTAWFLVVWVG